ncbi:hypothetical protein QBC32DRAFT_342043 [Pseudoneurospora amorphoporcata]|uniref:Uncharacterized protein n=1 Tax=Pseudoneurospora amorphoporcata TaxID=241081 RepID=A0AAN6NW73_9PEZI|nr:hypothetical protein QBC32DRAFT_342043 [Pseudoneurospora amorphoporcata]
MDVAYNQHSHAARRKNRSSTNLNHLSLAPLTSKLPIDNDDFLEQYGQQFEPVPRTTSYLQGKSAPATPRLISHSPGPHPARASTMTGTGMNHSRGKSAPAARLPKSKSTTHLGSKSGAASPTHTRRSAAAVAADNERNLSDWLLRAGALISTETRESKGQSWLASRASSTSLTGLHNAEEEAFERELARERELLLQNTAANGIPGIGSRNVSRNASRNASRRGSLVITTGNNIIDDEYYTTSPIHSRLGSRSHSRTGSRTQLARTPNERHALEHSAGYFHHHGMYHHQQHHEVGITEEDDEDTNGPGPDFVNIDEKLELAHYNQQQLLLENDAAISMVEDEIAVRRLVKDRNIGSWFGRVLGVQLFAVEEDDEEDSSDSDRDEDDDQHMAYGGSRQHSEGQSTEDDDGSTTETDSSSEGARRRPHDKQRREQRRFEDAQLSKLVDEKVPAPKEEGGTWHDAAWLLTVASKVIF